MEIYHKHLIDLLAERPVDTSQWDRRLWSKIYHVAKEHDLHCLLFHLLNHHNHQSWRHYKLASKWQDEYLNETFTLQHFMKQVEFMLLELSYAQVDHIVLKGSALKSYYPNTFVRLMSDVDLLISPQDMKKVEGVFLEQGYRILKKTSKDITYMKEGHIPFEIHHTLFTPVHIKNGDTFTKLAFENKKHVAEHQFRLSPELNVAYLIGHAVKHFYYMGIGLKSLYDINVSIKAHIDQLDRDLLFNYLSLLGCHKSGIYLVELCIRHLDLIFDHGYPIEDEVLDWLMSKILFSGRQGQSEFSMALKIMITSKNAKRSLLHTKVCILFPGYELMSERYPMLRKQAWLLPGVWIHRIVKLCLNHRTRQLLINGWNYEILAEHDEMIKRLKEDI